MAAAFALTLISGVLLFKESGASTYLNTILSWFGLDLVLKGHSFSTATLGILAAGLLGLLLGVYDDHYGMKARQKFIGQLLITMVLVRFDLRIERLGFPFFPDVPLPGAISFVCTFFWVAATMNAINLIDGLDGLAAGISLIAALGLLFLAGRTGNVAAALVSVGIVGVCLGFLYYNFQPASVFMGDGGSMFLGATFSGLSLLVTHNGATSGSLWIPLWIPITFLAVPFLDTTLAIIRRMYRRQYPFMADQEHLHHQLLDFGLSQRQAVLVLYTLGLLMGGVAIASFLWGGAHVINTIAIIGVVLLAGGLVMTNLHRRKCVHVESSGEQKEKRDERDGVEGVRVEEVRH